MIASKKVCVVLPASGSGERMALETPKQFCEIAGKPVVCHTITAFQRQFIKCTNIFYFLVEWVTLAHQLGETQVII